MARTSAGRIPYKGQIAFVVVAALALALATTLSFSVSRYVRDLGVAQQDQAQWRATQLEVEFLKLSAAVTAAERAEDAPDLDHLRERFDVFYSRIPLIRENTLNPSDLAQMIELRQALDGIIPLIDGSDATLLAGLDRVATVIREHEKSPRTIALGSIRGVADERAEERARIAQLLEVMLGTIVAITLILVLVIGFLIRRTVMLQDASMLANEKQQQLEAILSGSLDAIIVTDSRGRLVDFNGSAETMFGHKAEDVLGKAEDVLGKDCLNLLVPQPFRDEIAKNLKRYLETGQKTILDRGVQEMSMLRADGTEFPVQFTSSTARTNDEPLFISYIRDVTMEKRYEAEILQARDTAVQAFRERSRYFAMMSHEMRTPLNGVLSALYLLEESPLNEEQLGYIKTALFSGDILISHINDVLAIERSESEEDLTNTPCDVDALCSSMMGMMQTQAVARNVALDLQTKGLDGRMLMTAPRALQQILTNLLSNAIKFSPEGAVSLFAHYVPSDDKSRPGHLRFEIGDTGIGIAPEDQKRIFEDFVSLDSRYERRTGGTGLGLGIARRFVERLNGTIRCESDIGEGATFIVEFPVYETSKTNQECSQISAPTALKMVSKKILVVDDNSVNRNLLCKMLEVFGQEVTLADGGQAAIDVTATQPFDLILMDISMPDISGTQATRTIRTRAGLNKSTPIVAFTAHALPQEQKAFREAGMCGFLLKPVNRQALWNCLVNDYDAVETPDPIPQQDAEQTPALLDKEQISDLEALLGPDQLYERYEAFCLNVAGRIQALEAAREQDDTRAMQETGHALSGMCGMMGAHRMRLLFTEIEQACKTDRVAQAKALISDVPDVFTATREAWEARTA